MIEMAPFGDDAATIEKQIMAHNKTHSSLQRSPEVDRARDEQASFSPGLIILLRKRAIKKLDVKLNK